MRCTVSKITAKNFHVISSSLIVVTSIKMHSLFLNCRCLWIDYMMSCTCAHEILFFGYVIYSLTKLYLNALNFGAAKEYCLFYKGWTFSMHSCVSSNWWYSDDIVMDLSLSNVTRLRLEWDEFVDDFIFELLLGFLHNQQHLNVKCWT